MPSKRRKSSRQELRPISKPRNEGRATPRNNVDSSYGYYNRYQNIFLGYYYYCKNFGHQAKHWKAQNNEAPTLKDQTNKLCGPKEQGQIKTYNSFDPLAKFDLTCPLCNNYDHNEQNCLLKREEAKSVNFKMDKCGLALCAHSEENHWFVDSGCSRHMKVTKRILSH